MKLELREKGFDPNYPNANYAGIYEKTELNMTGTAVYESGNRERFTARAFTSMYGAIHMRLTIHHPISLSDTDIAVTLNKSAFDKQGIEYNDMDAVLPLLVDHASKKNNHGVLISKCIGVEFDS